MILNRNYCTDITMLGRHLLVYISDDKGELSIVSTSNSVSLDVLGIMKNMHDPSMMPSILLGSTAPTSGLVKRSGQMYPGWIYVHNQEIYTYSRGLVLPAEIYGMKDVVPIDKTKCHKCGYENYSGTSNQPDGTYVCQQCSIFSHIFGATT